MLKTMRTRTYAVSFLFVVAFLWSAPARAEIVTLYSQPDNSGEMLSQQATFQNTWIESASLGNLVLGKDSLRITFTMKDPNAGNIYRTPTGVAIKACSTGQNLQTYRFTDTDRTLLSDGVFHTFTVQTGTTTLGIADGETPICITFFGLSQYHLGTHLKSNAVGTIPYLIIEGTPPPLLVIPQAPEGAVTVYVQEDKTGIMTNPQATFQNAHIDSASLGNLNLGQGKLYITFIMKDPRANNTYHQPGGVALGTCSGCRDLQTYFFTDADRTLLADQASHTFMVETGTTTSTYADGTRPVFISFFNLSQYQYGTKIKSNAAQTIPYLIIQKPAPPDLCATPGACASNVLFLPGIEASRLYRPDGQGGETKLWEPGGDTLAGELAHDTSGASINTDIYVKKNGVIDNAYVPIKGNIYKSFIEQMNDLVTADTINAWEAIPYDWRLTPDQILESGALVAPNKISYLAATSSPYIIQELKHLAATSKTHKVTIIAHSNGGLMTKRLTELLGSDASVLIDKIVFVAVPQTGAPQAIGALLHGYDQGLPTSFISYGLSDSAARTLAKNMPMTYNMLPSAGYFAQVNAPVVTFADQPLLAPFRVRYGDTIQLSGSLHTFLTDSWRLASSTTEGLNYPSVGNDALLTRAETLHTTDVDNWAPPSGVTLYEVAGWGENTLARIDYYQGVSVHCDTFVSFFSGCTKTLKIEYRPRIVLDGDGTVPTPSALWTPGAKRYWVDLQTYNGFFGTTKHASILEVPQLRTFLQSIITNNASTSLPQYISTSTPINPNPGTELRFTLHSPLALNLYDDAGRHTGVSTTTGELEENIPESRYMRFGEVQLISVPTSQNTTLVMNGYAEGSFTLDAEEVSGESIIASTTFAGIPSGANTTATMEVPSGGLVNAGALIVDENSDGHAEIVLTPKLGDVVVPHLDTTPPEIQVTFSTTTKSVAFIGTDDNGSPTVTSTTIYPALKKNQKEKKYQGIATTTVIASDAAGNITALVYTERLPSPKERDVITLQALAYNGATTTLASASLSYKWRVNKNGSFSVFASNLHNASTTLESHYRPKKNTTLLMTKPQELDDSESDDDSDVRPIKQTLPGMVVPYIMTKKGSVIISY